MTTAPLHHQLPPCRLLLSLIFVELRSRSNAPLLNWEVRAFGRFSRQINESGRRELAVQVSPERATTSNRPVK